MKPILFNTEMVRAILEGRKTVTRRVIKGARSIFHFLDLETDPDICSVNRWGDEVPKTVKGLYAEFEADDSYPIEFPMFKSSYQVGDILYVRETWGFDNHNWLYKADFSDENLIKLKRLLIWHPSIHMPKKAARIFLRVTDVRVERLQDIPPKEAGNEGVSWETDNSGLFRRWKFHKLWDSTINKKDLDEYGWNANPWVWVIEFERIEKGEQ